VICPPHTGEPSSNLPKVDRIFDHFHGTKLIDKKMNDLRETLQREAKILGRKYLRVGATCDWMKRRTYSEDRKGALAEAQRFNEQLSTASNLKENLPKLCGLTNRALMQGHLQSWCKRAPESEITQLAGAKNPAGLWDGQPQLQPARYL